jgi:hypothetical protein
VLITCSWNTLTQMGRVTTGWLASIMTRRSPEFMIL